MINQDQNKAFIVLSDHSQNVNTVQTTKMTKHSHFPTNLDSISNCGFLVNKAVLASLLSDD